MKVILTEEEKNIIREAIEVAEKQTSGEIVPYLVKQSDFYLDAILKSALSFNIFTLLILYIYEKLGIFTEYLSVPNVILITFFVSILGGLIGYIPFVRRILAGKATLEYRVRLRAWEAFVEREVFRTKNRTGVLIFISFLERMVYVLGDSGINQKVKIEDWQEIVNTIVESIKKGQLSQGIINAIHLCGELLKKSGLSVEKGDINEITNEITEKDR
ncbi:MAG: TPM domain-containing protein [Leptonema sp. (in: bacteria)]